MRYTIETAWPRELIENLFIISGQNQAFMLISEIMKESPLHLAPSLPISELTEKERGKKE